MTEELHFGIEGYYLTPATYDEYEFVMDGVKACILASVSEKTRFFSDLWINDIMNISGSVIQDGSMGSEVYILRNEYEKIGMLWLSVSKDQFTCDGTGYVMGIFIRKTFRGRGLGKELMKSAEEWCSRKGLLSLTLNVGSENKVASALYSSMGYRPQSVVMKKNLI